MPLVPLKEGRPALSLAPGSRIGPYQSVALLGAGGMGEVYRATDPKLGRDVALKILPELFAADPERLARFEREAKVLASLNHPGIAHLYGFEAVSLPGGTTAHVLVMELVPGEDLAERLERGPLPVDEAIAIAGQVAEALEEAHEKGIVHRDLKPANVKVTPDGKVKVLDFGLAKAWDGDSQGAASSAGLSQSPTLAHTGTAAGLILGTAAYMSPEQARGKVVDRRADVWAFGVLLYEILTGRRLFEGETVTDVLASVVKDPIPWTTLPASTPSGVKRVLERCLERDPRLRLRDVGEARIALRDPAAGREPAPPSATTGRLTRRRAAVLALVALAAGGGGALLGRAAAPRPAIPPVVRLTYALPAGARLGQPPFDDVRALALSPDGSRLAFASDRIYIRPLDSLDAVEVPGTTRASNPFFSPDGAWLGFSAGGSLRKVNLAGGNPVEIAATGGPASWGEDGTILVANAQGVLQVPADGGTPRTLVAPEPGYFRTDPQFLPGGTGFLYTRSRPGGSPARELRACPVDGKDCSTVAVEARDARYVATGHILYAAAAGVTALPFDPVSRRATGPPAVVEQVSGLNVYDNYFFDVSASSGTLVYAAATSDVAPTRLFYVSPTGGASAVPGEPRFFSDPRVSPDGRRAAVHVQDGENDVWVADLGRGTLLRLSTVPGEDETPVWSPDGRFVAWTGTRPDLARGVFRRPADGSGPEELLYAADVHLHVNDWTPDGETLLLQLVDPKTGPDLYTLDLESGKAAPFLQTRFREHSARLSPDGRHLAYVSDESGQNEVYVQTFPELGPKLRVSTDGGEQPVWSRDGRQLFFRDRPSVWAARFDAGPPSSVSVPQALFTDHYESPQVGTHTGYDVLPDGRFLMAEASGRATAGEARTRAVVFVLNSLQNMNGGAASR